MFYPDLLMKKKKKKKKKKKNQFFSQFIIKEVIIYISNPFHVLPRISQAETETTKLTKLWKPSVIPRKVL